MCQSVSQIAIRSMTVPSTWRCEVCKAAQPNVICLIPMKQGMARTVACPAFRSAAVGYRPRHGRSADGSTRNVDRATSCRSRPGRVRHDENVHRRNHPSRRSINPALRAGPRPAAEVVARSGLVLLMLWLATAAPMGVVFDSRFPASKLLPQPYPRPSALAGSDEVRAGCISTVISTLNLHCLRHPMTLASI
jgi:hypothetical protein